MMKYTKELIDMSLRLGHTPEYLVKTTIKSNYKFILFYCTLTLFAFCIFIASIVGLSEDTILSDIIGTFGITVSLCGWGILNVMSAMVVFRSIFDRENLAVEILSEEQREYETTAECNQLHVRG